MRGSKIGVIIFILILIFSVVFTIKNSSIIKFKIAKLELQRRGCSMGANLVERFLENNGKSYDISKEYEEEIKKRGLSKEKYIKNIFDNSPYKIYYVNNDGKITFNTTVKPTTECLAWSLNYHEVKVKGEMIDKNHIKNTEIILSDKYDFDASRMANPNDVSSEEIENKIKEKTGIEFKLPFFKIQFYPNEEGEKLIKENKAKGFEITGKIIGGEMETLFDLK